MSAQWDGSSLLEPIAADTPCGANLEDTDALAAFNVFELFGQTTLEPQKHEQTGKEIKRKHRPPEWREIKDLALETLGTSKDLRLLAYLGTAMLRTDGLLAFVETIDVASKWLEQYWSNVYPLLDEGDPVFRRNALNLFADPVAVVDGLRRVALVDSRQLGRFTLRELEVTAGQLSAASAAGAEPPADVRQLRAAFASLSLAELQGLVDGASRALASLTHIDAVMRREAGIEGAPSFEALSEQLKKMEFALREQYKLHPAAVAAVANEVVEPGETGATGEVGAPVVAVGTIRSREDAIRALEAAAEFFRKNEPSSPVPMFLDRAKRLVSKDFLEVLADVVPDALQQARAAGGIKDE